MSKVEKIYVQRIVLTGFMGSGKSTVGPLVAARLGWRFIDVDPAIEAEAGMTIAEIFRRAGEVQNGGGVFVRCLDFARRCDFVFV